MTMVKLMIHAGNHSRVIWKYAWGVTEWDEPQGYNKDVIVYKDEWIDFNAILFVGLK